MPATSDKLRKQLDEQFRPMLASAAELGELRYPLMASPKIDGVRCIIRNGVAVSRGLKPIRHGYVQQMIGRSRFEGLDGELVVGSATDRNCMQNTQAVMRKSSDPIDFTFLVFDDVRRAGPFRDRFDGIVRKLGGTQVIKRVPHHWVAQESELLKLEADCLAQGYEGLILRDPSGPYKMNRSTVGEGWMLKLKRFADSEAEVIGVEEQMHNDNERETNELGRAKRSHRAEGLRPAGVLGALIVRDLKTGVEFNIGTGFTAEQRAELWAGYQADQLGRHPRNELIGRIVTYKYFAATGVKEKPRFPVFKSFRDAEDL